ncbi:hypothetical protein Pint_18912 [Pistacia integerrima]|uniref:Uncharacterized protein n=1 Tax=Pistacia integerrima TaxID=434235 RepID=A0ACC0YXT9_9ROSI|nr:hypothetical protein Pint_18912 [Pistacia integerrima]
MRYICYDIPFHGFTGRFTNGRTIADFTAEFLGLPYSPPYLSLINNESVPVTGLNFHLPPAASFLKVEAHYNDYMCNYLQPKFFNTSKIYAPQPFAQLLIDALSPKLERLYNLGARKIVMFEIGAVGCIPAIKREGVKCVEDKNQLVSYFNDGLLAMLRNLTTTLKGFQLCLTNANNPCCTTWRNGESACIPFLKPCPKADKFYFWDGFHPTEAVHSLIASGCINNASVCIPVTLKDLVNM